MADKFKGFSEDLSNLDCSSGTCLYSGRNKVFRIRMAGHDMAVKKFRRSFLSGIMYMFRHSKARRSFYNASELVRRGIGTPSPVAFVEKRGLFGFLKESCYICEYEAGLSLGEFLLRDVSKYYVLKRFAEFVSCLHDRGIMHNDLNSSNVRISTSDDGGLRFSLIDLNRMKIKPFGVRMLLIERFADITKFSDLTADLCFFVQEYLRASGLSQSDFKTAIIVKAKEACTADRKKMWKKLLHNKK